MTDQPASRLHFPSQFSKSEWPGDVLDNMSAQVLKQLFTLRSASGVPMYPSALTEAHVRKQGESRHSTKGGERLSDATDIHVKSRRQLAAVFRHAQRNPVIGGIGLYFDTNRPMFHIDCRPVRLMWLRIDGDYFYEQNDPAHFYELLGRELRN